MKRYLKIWILTVVLWAVGCAAYTAEWEGSVDAVFRYRPQDSSTAVVEIRPESFSEEAGLQTGDVVLSVDGKNVTGAAFEEVRAALRGPVGTLVRLTVKRGDAVTDVSIERRPIIEK